MLITFSFLMLLIPAKSLQASYSTIILIFPVVPSGILFFTVTIYVLLSSVFIDAISPLLTVILSFANPSTFSLNVSFTSKVSDCCIVFSSSTVSIFTVGEVVSAYISPSSSYWTSSNLYAPNVTGIANATSS